MLQDFRWRLGFWLSYPFVLLAYSRRQRRRGQVLYPRRWFGPSQIVQIDLEGIEDEEISKLDRSFLDMLIARRDHIKSTYWKIALVNLSIFLYVSASYFAVVADISILGVSIKSDKGVAEVLLAMSSTIGVYTTIMYGNIAILDGAISHLIRSVFPRGTESIVRSALLTEYQSGKYFPSNAPHIVFTGIHSRFSQLGFYATGAIYVLVMLAVMAINVLLIVSLWDKASIPYASRTLVIYVCFCFSVSFILVYFTRLPNPYKDYTALQRIQVAEQLNPAHAAELRMQAYREAYDDRANLERQGFLKPLSASKG